MNRKLLRPPRPGELLAGRAFSALQHFLHIEAASGVILLLAAVIALLWANSPWAATYEHFWHTPLFFGFGGLKIEQSLHFWINDALMTVFFLVVGMEIRREIHEGALASPRQALLPAGAALGGVAVPALIYLALNPAPLQQQGWAIPTATDIAFAVGVLALLGRGIPANVRIFLLALAIIDDIVAVLIIALFYSGGLDSAGLIVAGAGILLVLALQGIGVAPAYAYILPGALLWFGLLKTGAHPTLAGVILGLMTPVLPRRAHEYPLDAVKREVDELHARSLQAGLSSPEQVAARLARMRSAQRDLLPAVTRVQLALHPWVAFGIMPLFALANAGVSLSGADLSLDSSQQVLLGISLALVLGKPLGVLLASALMVRLNFCTLPPGVSWGGIALVGLLAGIGFTMSIFIGGLAFADPGLLAAAKLGILLASLLASVLGLLWGVLYRRRQACRMPATAAQ